MDPAPKSWIVTGIEIEGIKRTKPHVVLAEIDVPVGQRIAQEDWNDLILESGRRLKNTGLFGQVNIDFRYSDSTIERLYPVASPWPEYTAMFPPAEDDSIILVITITERWYLFPAPVFELADRNFNTWWTQFDRDLSRINFGLNLISYNTTGNRDDLEAILQWGFNPKAELIYRRPNLRGNPRHGLNLLAHYSNTKQVPYIIQDNREEFITLDEFALRRFRVAAGYQLRNGPNEYHLIEAKFNANRITDTIIDLNNQFFYDRTPSDNPLRQRYFTLTYQLRYDEVDNRAYPLKGHFTRITARKIGLGIFGELNQWNFIFQHNEYFELPAGFYFAGMAKIKSTVGPGHPYYNREGFGFCQNFVRGYELYVIDGETYGLGKFNLKRKLFDFSIPNYLRGKEGREEGAYSGIPFAFYLKGYGDIGWVQTETGPEDILAEEFLLGGGIGLDLVTFYDWVFRFEYSFNRHGDQGLFVHWELDLNTYEDCNLW